MGRSWSASPLIAPGCIHRPLLWIPIPRACAAGQSPHPRLDRGRCCLARKRRRISKMFELMITHHHSNAMRLAQNNAVASRPCFADKLMMSLRLDDWQSWDCLVDFALDKLCRSFNEPLVLQDCFKKMDASRELVWHVSPARHWIDNSSIASLYCDGGDWHQNFRWVSLYSDRFVPITRLVN
jgi:hypothetical protein